MKATQAEKQLIKELQILKTNLRSLTAQQKIDMAQEGEFLITAKQFQAICQERNERAAINSRLSQENTRKVAQIAKLEAELSQARQDGGAMRRCLKKDLAEMTDEQLREYGLVTVEAANKKILEMQRETHLVVQDMDKTYNLIEKDNK